ncbi:MAG: penicillin-binding protein activator [Deltaproteobacteria bacterium]|nr:penicillin-binding protein activator [Deltaproteobacteria bacterium]
MKKSRTVDHGPWSMDPKPHRRFRSLVPGPWSLVFFFLLACSAKELPHPPAAPTTPSDEALWNDPKGTRLGLLLPLSGQYKHYGEAILNGVSCAAGLYEPCAMPARPARVLAKDTQGDPVVAAAAAQELIETEKVSALIGPLLSQEVEAVTSIAQDKKVPLIVLAPQKKGGSPRPYVFQHSLIPEKEVAQIILKARAAGLENFALFCPDNHYGRQYQELFRQQVEKEAAGKILAEAVYPVDLPDFTETLRRFLPRNAKAGPLGLFVPDSFRQVIKIAEALDALAFPNVRLIGTSRWHHPKLLARRSPSLEGALIDTPFYDADPQVLPFRENFLKAFGTEPAWLEAIGFDAAQLISQAVQTKGTDHPQAVRDGLGSIENFQAVVGPLSWDPEGISDWPFDFLTIQDRRFIPLP